MIYSARVDSIKFCLKQTKRCWGIRQYSITIWQSFSLQNHGNLGKWGRGEAYTSSTYNFKTQKHRGIECSTLIKFESSLGSDAPAKLVKGAESAFFKVGGEAEAGVVACF